MDIQSIASTPPPNPRGASMPRRGQNDKHA
ncbi:hypothetical protein CGMCC3_g18134 [Colletotrichum fructicola]|nr:hypothetical protein CGMCC3_g18134 [Colletotrichum fructicola]